METIKRKLESRKDVRLVAVSKKRSVNDIRQLYKLGQRDFGENLVQEAKNKQDELKDLDICWHFIGRIQSNKAKYITQRFDWVQSLDRITVAKKLNDNRRGNDKPLNVCIQVNIDEEPQKNGVSPDQVVDLLDYIVGKCNNLCLQGLMAIPAVEGNRQDSFHRMNELWKKLQSDGYHLPVLSMGMSQDYELALENGANMIRIGNALFSLPREK